MRTTGAYSFTEGSSGWRTCSCFYSRQTNKDYHVYLNKRDKDNGPLPTADITI
jgi:hypothetical protein